MASTDFNLRFILSVIGAEKVDQAVNKTGKAAKEAGAELNSVGEAGKRAAEGTEKLGGTAGKAGRELAGAAKEADNLGTKLKDVDTTGRTAMTGLIGQLDAVEGRLKRAADATKRWDEIQGKISKVKLVGAGIAAVGAGMIGAAVHAVGKAGDAELQKEAIDAVTHQEGRGQEVYEFAQGRATKSTYGVDELVQGAKTLELRGLNTEKYLTAADDAAATSAGATPEDVARALGRLKTGDYGEGFERLRDFGVSRADLEAKGLEFDKGGAYTDQSAEGAQKAVDAVVEVIEEKFGGLSEKMATGTFSGAVSQFGDAIGTLVQTVGQQLLPQATAVVNFVGNIASLVSSFAKANPVLAKVIAYGLLIGGAFLVVGGGLIMLIGTLAGAYINILALTTANAANTEATVANTSAKLANAEAEGVNAAATRTASATLMTSAVTAAAALALLAVAIAGIYVAAKGSKDAGNMSDKDLKDKWGPLGDFWVWASGSDQDPGADENDRKNYEMYVDRERKRGRQAKSFEEWRGNPVADDASAGEDMRTPEQKAADEMDAKMEKQQHSIEKHVDSLMEKYSSTSEKTSETSTINSSDIQARSRLEQLPGHRTRIKFDDIDLGEPTIQRQSRHYVNNRPA